ITLEIRRALSDPEVSLAQLNRLISRDPALSAILMKYASSALLRTQLPPKSLLDVLRVLGIAQVDRITMVHSVKSLFTLHSPAHKKLFLEAWERLVLKASSSAFLARVVGHVAPDQALLASLLSEVGTLAVLSAFKNAAEIPSPELYYKLCREYSKSLGVIVLKKWAVDDAYIKVIRHAGDWHYHERAELELVDLINLSLFHAIKLVGRTSSLPPLTELAAYAKLPAPLDFISDSGELTVLLSHSAEIEAIAASLR
ncbi:MAG: HDOD domain-containing protein, partial [Pseudomonas sp.]|nr:HDOD domain-containing protein [Pseudomonas sp.]